MVHGKWFIGSCSHDEGNTRMIRPDEIIIPVQTGTVARDLGPIDLNRSILYEGNLRNVECLFHDVFDLTLIIRKNIKII